MTPRQRLHPCTNTFWVRTFGEARLIGAWTRVERLYTQKTAAQLASDIRCSHRRTPQAKRVRGMHDGEVWAARAFPAIDGAPGDQRIEILLLATASWRGVTGINPDTRTTTPLSVTHPDAA